MMNLATHFADNEGLDIPLEAHELQWVIEDELQNFIFSTDEIFADNAVLQLSDLVQDETISGISSYAQPESCSYQIVNTYPHDENAFTQGLVYSDGELYEGTGLNGLSSLRRVDLGLKIK